MAGAVGCRSAGGRASRVRRMLGATVGVGLVAAQLAPPLPAAAGAEPTPRWVARYNGPGNDQDTPAAVAVSPDGGTVFVTGSSHAASRDFATVAYDAASGNERWLARYDGPGGGADAPVGLAVSPDGSRVFVTGSSDGGDATRTDYATIAYDARTGTQLWVARFDGPAHYHDFPVAIAVSADGTAVFVTGQTTVQFQVAVVPVPISDFGTVAYRASDGTQLWVARYDGTGGTDFPKALAVDGGRVFVTGVSAGPAAGPGATGFDVATVAYEPLLGGQLWAARYDRAGGWDGGAAVVGSEGLVLVAATTSPAPTGPSDITMLAYDAATGSLRWQDHYDGPASDHDSATALTVSGGTAVVSGPSRGTGTGAWDFATLAYRAASGTRLWVSRYDGPASDFDEPRAVAFSRSGSTVLVAGRSVGQGTSFDFATVAYEAASGVPRWTARYDAGGADAPVGLAISPDRRAFYVAGESLGSGTSLDFATVAYATHPPQAAFTVSPSRPQVGQAVSFTDASADPDGRVVRWGWDFGDGSTSSEPSPSHSYTRAGTYTVRLTVTDDDGLEDSAAEAVRVLAPPVADFAFSPPSPQETDTVTFVDRSTDPDGSVVAWSYRCTDGFSGASASPSHRFADGGSYQCTQTVTDDDGLSDSKTKTLQVAHVPPKADFTAAPLGGGRVQFTDTSTHPNPADAPPAGWAYAWDFEDDGRFDATDRNPQHEYGPRTGSVAVRLRVTDDDGLSDEVVKPVLLAPPATPSPSPTPTPPPGGVVLAPADPDRNGVIGLEELRGGVLLEVRVAVAAGTDQRATVQGVARDAVGRRSFAGPVILGGGSPPAADLGFDVGRFADGLVVVEVAGTLEDGRAVGERLQVVLDRTPPQTTITTPRGSVFYAVPILGFHNVEIRGTVQDAVGVRTVALAFRNRTLGTTYGPFTARVTGTAPEFTWTLRGFYVDPGQVDVLAWGIDEAQNVEAPPKTTSILVL